MLMAVFVAGGDGGVGCCGCGLLVDGALAVCLFCDGVVAVVCADVAITVFWWCWDCLSLSLMVVGIAVFGVVVCWCCYFLVLLVFGICGVVCLSLFGVAVVYGRW